MPIEAQAAVSELRRRLGVAFGIGGLPSPAAPLRGHAAPVPTTVVQSSAVVRARAWVVDTAVTVGSARTRWAARYEVASLISVATKAFSFVDFWDRNGAFARSSELSIINPKPQTGNPKLINGNYRQRQTVRSVHGQGSTRRPLVYLAFLSVVELRCLCLHNDGMASRAATHAPLALTGPSEARSRRRLARRLPPARAAAASAAAAGTGATGTHGGGAGGAGAQLQPGLLNSVSGAELTASSLEAVGWHEVCAHLAEFASTKLGQAACRDLELPMDGAWESELLLDETQAAIAMESFHGVSLDFGGILSAEVRKALYKAEKYASLGGDELVGPGRCCSCSPPTSSDAI